MAYKNKRRGEAVIDNKLIYNHYYNRLMELAISRFQWNNLPDTVDARFLEITLCNYGFAIFFKDEVMGYLALKSMINGPLNVYNIPVRRKAYANNGYQKELNESDSVIIYNNMMHTNVNTDLKIFADKLYQIDRTLMVNINAQKTPVAILCDENQRLTMMNLYAKYEGNEPFIFGSKNLDLKSIQSINTQAPYIADKLWETKTQLWNEAMTYLGISNVSMVKKERLVTDEVSRNMGATVASRYSELRERQRACDRINKMFGLNVSVEYNSDVLAYSDEELLDDAGEMNDEDRMEV